jgi:D-alanine--poly(phosphoribitol) ligase subunit 1
MDFEAQTSANPTEWASSLAQLFFSRATQYSNQPALVIGSKIYTYAELSNTVRQLAAYLKTNHISRLGILASRSLMSYAGVLAAHWLGIAYIPLNPALPILRLKKIIAHAQLKALVIDQASLHADELQTFHIIQQEEIQTFSPLQSDPVKPADEDLAYIIFTSGTTGVPKGVPILFGNLRQFIDVITKRYPLNVSDRVSQYSVLSFDVSIFDMCLAFGFGAALYVVPEEMLLAPANFIRENDLTVWLSVPAVISFMHKLKILKPNFFPSLKLSLFTGEAFTYALAKEWQQAAPLSQLENLYGPTEGTIDCLAQIVSNTDAKADIYETIPIGKPFPEVYAALINSEQQFLSRGEKGELVLAGGQIAAGYWQEPEISQKKFVELNHPEWGRKKWYLTGDYCFQDDDGCFHYLYRLDNQRKILGYRIELDEIEHYIRELSKSSEVVALIIPTEHYPHAQIIAVVNVEEVDARLLKSELKKHLPLYMIPEHIIYMDSMIYNVNGKLDRQSLTRALIKIFKSDAGNFSC